MAERERMLNVRLSREEYDMLLELCDEHGVTQSGLVRQWIRKAYRKMGGDTARPKP